jgi:hypothetical protein
MSIDPHAAADDAVPPDEAATWLLDAVAAVDHLRRGYRPGFTVWDALEEALRWHATDGTGEPPWDDADPLRRAITAVLGDPADLAATLQDALRRWVQVMAERFNAGHHWPHPAARRGFPPPRLEL